MTNGRLEFGKWQSYLKRSWKDYFDFDYEFTACKCHILTISIFYITWLGDECYNNPKENEE